MAKEDEAYRISAEQLIKEAESRKLIPLSLTADIALGGGVPVGSTVVLAGKPGCGKTTISLQYAANAQNLYGSKIFFFPIEGRLTQLVLKQIRGIKTGIDNFEVIRPPAIFDKEKKLLGFKKWDAQVWWSEIGKTIQNNSNAIIIIDSLSSLSSEREVSEGMGYQGRGDTQKLEAQFMRIYGNQVISNQITIFLLAQIQANTSGYGPPIQAKAGNAVKHQADISLLGLSVEKWKEEDGRIQGQDTTYRMEKNAGGQPYLDVTVGIRFGYGVDDIRDIVTNAVTWEIVKRDGAWYKLPFAEDKKGFKYISIEENEKDCVKIQGESKVRAWMLEHNKEARIIENNIKQKVLGK